MDNGLINIQSLLRALNSRKGSDLHLCTGSRPMGRFDGELEPLLPEIVQESDMMSILQIIASPELIAQYKATGDLDLAWEVTGVSRYRVNYYRTFHGTAAAFRPIPTVVPSMDELGLPAHLKRLPMLDRGLVLVTGPAGSGKSTAIAAMVDYANQNRHEHILTIEDPIEFRYQNKKSYVSQREVGRHTNSFPMALRAALREDPDIIVVGEMRDPETISLALKAAETGHLVFATLHTSSAAKTIDRIIDSFPAEGQAQIRASLSESIRAILSVSLIKRANHQGRVQAMEILLATPAIRNLIRESKIYQIPNILQTNHDMGMCTMDDQLISFCLRGQISEQDALLHANNFEYVKSKVSRANV